MSHVTTRPPRTGNPGAVRGFINGPLHLTRHYVTSLYQGRRERAFFRDIRSYCLFIGHPRSGHSVVGALLDAHPEVILPDEVDVLRYLQAGFSRDQLCHLLLARSARQARRGRVKAGRNGKTYSYAVPGQWQGTFTQIRVIGSSMAGRSTARLAQDPALFDRLRETMRGMQIKLVLTVRNPFDNISTMIVRGRRTFDNAIEQYFFNCRVIARMQSELAGAEMLIVRHEDLLGQPQETLGRICAALDLESDEDYRAACAGILYTAPSRSRHSVPWTPELIERVQGQIDALDYLRGYSFSQ